jgi:outer membrane protein assembly factor BamC
MMEVSRQFLKVSLLAAALTATAGCSYLPGSNTVFRDRQGDYLVSPIAPPLSVPAELDSFTLEEMFPIPPENAVEGGAFITPPPPRPLDYRVREGVIVQRFGDRRWILIGATPGQVWPRLRDFWSTAQLSVAVENPVQGIMETEWLTAEGREPEKYRVRIEPALHAGNSEIYVVQISQSALGNAQTQDILSSHDLERENTMLSAISLYLADRTDLYRASSVSLLAGSIDIDSKANVVRGATGEFQLELRIDYERAWGQVGQSLNSMGVEIVDSERDARYLRVLFAGVELEEDRPGFFKRTFSRGSRTNQQPSSFLVRLSPESDGIITVTAQPEMADGEEQRQLRDELIQAISDNLI